MAHEAQVRYSNLVDLKLRKTLVKKVGVICNNRYEGSPKAGSVKVPVRDTEVVVNDYDKAKGAKQTSGDTTYLTVNIDHDKAVNEIIDGFDAESVPGDLVADRLDSAGYSLGLQMDSDGSTELTTAGTAFGTTTALTEKTIYANIVDARTQQSSIGVPTAGRWLLVSPDTYGLLLKSPEFIKASDLGDAVVQTGAVGKIAGYTVFEDSTLRGHQVRHPDRRAGSHRNAGNRPEKWRPGTAGPVGGFLLLAGLHRRTAGTDQQYCHGRAEPAGQCAGRGV